MPHTSRRAGCFSSTCRKVAARVGAVSFFAACLFARAPDAARAQSAGPSDIVISQLYTRGGESGATYQSDYIEIFNRSNAPVDINGYAIEVNNGGGVTAVITFSANVPLTMQPGRYLLFELARGTSGQPLPSPDFSLAGSGGPFTPSLGASGGYVALYRSTPTVQFGACPSGDQLADLVGYGNSPCREGSTAAPAPGLTTALLRSRAGCNDSNINPTDFQLGTPNPRNRFTPAAVCSTTPGASTIQFAAPQFDAAEADGHATITLSRIGDLTGPATIDYATSDATANERQDYTTALGTVRFEPGENFKTFDILLTDDAAQEGNETVGLALSNPTGLATLGVRQTASLLIHDNDFSGSPAENPIDSPAFFVRQHYHDFLNREPDAAGLDFWVNQTTNCGDPDPLVCRINVSAAFFLSTEFQETGFLAYKTHGAAFGLMRVGGRVPLNFREFMTDAQQLGRGVIIGQPGAEAVLEANKVAYFDSFVQRAQFTSAYPASMSAAQFVDALNANTGNSLTSAERDQLAADLGSGAKSRAQVLRAVAENPAFSDAEKNRAFVLTEYFGYLRRNPFDAPEPTLDFQGYDFWLGKLNDHGGNYITAEMVKAFITSPEYRARFAQ